MNRNKVEITVKTIVLGIFGTETFRYFKNKGAYDYGDEPIFSIETADSVIEAVRFACAKADKIIFILDGIYFPINPRESLTCSELHYICSNDGVFDKTVFIKEQNVIEFDKNLVL